jgi:SAM-dependent methyltransferase
MIDWSIGSYERTAATLEDVSTAVVAAAGISPGEVVLDVACGTGNATLKAAALGASVTGVDLAPRLVLVGKERARAAGLQARFLTGDAQDLPVDSASVDVALSVFGLIFAPDQSRTAAELVRVLTPGGRALITGWVPEGALAEVGAAMGRALAEAAGGPAPGSGGPPPVNWGDPAAVRELFAGHPVSVETREATVPFVAASPEAWSQEQIEHHPLWISARESLGDDGFAALNQELLRILHAANEDPAGFRVTSRYLVVTIRRS